MPEGRIPIRGYETWWRSVGESEPGKLPVLCLHGGPGAPHWYLEPLEALADAGRQTVLYDQLGCGASAIGESRPDLWTVELFVAEVGAVREALGLERVHLFGHSWGGMLALEYALTEPPGLASLVVGHSPASMPQWVEETGRLGAQLPQDVQETLDRTSRRGRRTIRNTSRRARSSTGGTSAAPTRGRST